MEGQGGEGYCVGGGGLKIEVRVWSEVLAGCIWRLWLGWRCRWGEAEGGG